QDAMQVASIAGLALALDRSGQHDEAKAVVAERVRADVKPLLSDPRVVESLADAGVTHEGEALLAIALEGVDVALAKDAWRRYVDGPGGRGVWAEQAREHLGASSAVKKPTASSRATAVPARGPR